MTDIAFDLTKRVWRDLPVEGRGQCFFCIGGVNAINPFSATAVKNEIFVYAEAVSKDAKRIRPDEGAFYDMSGNLMPAFDISVYDEVYMDFNGSMAFFNDDWRKRLSEVASVGKVTAAYCLQSLEYCRETFRVLCKCGIRVLSAVDKGKHFGSKLMIMADSWCRHNGWRVCRRSANDLALYP